MTGARLRSLVAAVFRLVVGVAAWVLVPWGGAAGRSHSKVDALAHDAA